MEENGLGRVGLGYVYNWHLYDSSQVRAGEIKVKYGLPKTLIGSAMIPRTPIRVPVYNMRRQQHLTIP